MLTIKQDNKKFSFRVAGIALHDGKVLLHQYEDNEFYAFPGGRAEMFESSEETIIREMKEELDDDIMVERLLFVNESFYEHTDYHVHELCHYYEIHFKEGANALKEDQFIRKEIDGATLRFTWIPLDQVDSLLVYPESIKKKLSILPDCIVHTVEDDINRKTIK